MKINIEFEIGNDMIENLFVSAFEGGYSPWIETATQEAGDEPENKGVVWYGSQNIYNERLQFRLKYDLETDDEGEFSGDKVFGWSDVERALRTMAKDAPRHFADILNDNTDAITGDLLLQYIAFDKAIYG
jgi:hypothetical protein